MEEMNNQILENQAMQTDQEMAMPAPEKKKLPLIIAAATAVGVIAAVIITLVALKAFKYKKAFKLIDDGEYLAAYELFESLGDYKDSKAQLNRFHYVPTKMTVTQYDDSYVTECYYDDNNFPRLIIETDLDDGDVFKGDFTYADDGKLTKIAYTDYDGTVSTVTFTYDKRGNTVSETFYSDNYSYTHLREYNEKNQLIKESEIYDDGEKYTVTYTYDARGNLIREVFESSYGSGSTTEYFYDDNNNMIKEIGPYETITYTYDANGNLILLAHSSGTNRVYTYDENGNLIREVQTSSYSDPDVFTYVPRLMAAGARKYRQIIFIVRGPAAAPASVIVANVASGPTKPDVPIPAPRALLPSCLGSFATSIVITMSASAPGAIVAGSVLKVA